MADSVPTSAHAKEAKQKPRSPQPVAQGPTPVEEYLVPRVQRAMQDPATASPADILALQHAAGNRAVSRLIQAQRLAEGQEEDLQAKNLVQRQEEGDGAEVQPDVEQRLAVGKGSGSPLPDELRAFMEPRFEANFGGVRVHADSEAAQLSGDLSAQAFTHGQDIYFGPGKYDPASDAGKRLVAHELTHTVQQGASAATSRGPGGAGAAPHTVQRKWGHPGARYDDAVSYLDSIDGRFGAEVSGLTQRRRDGHIISLGRAGARLPLAQRNATRALLLTLCAFGLRGEVGAAKEHWIGQSVGDINDAIQSWWTLTTPGDLAAVAQGNMNLGGGVVPVYQQRRGNLQVSGANCNLSVGYWLFLAGIVSLRWIRDNHHGDTAGLVNTLALNQTYANYPGGTANPIPIPTNSIPSAHVVYLVRWNLSRHYAVSVGHGACIGRNNINTWDPPGRWIPAPPADGPFAVDDYLRACQWQAPNPPGIPCLIKHGDPSHGNVY